MYFKIKLILPSFYWAHCVYASVIKIVWVGHVWIRIWNESQSNIILVDWNVYNLQTEKFLTSLLLVIENRIIWKCHMGNSWTLHGLHHKNVCKETHQVHLCALEVMTTYGDSKNLILNEKKMCSIMLMINLHRCRYFVYRKYGNISTFKGNVLESFL